MLDLICLAADDVHLFPLTPTLAMADRFTVAFYAAFFLAALVDRLRARRS